MAAAISVNPLIDDPAPVTYHRATILISFLGAGDSSCFNLYATIAHRDIESGASAMKRVNSIPSVTDNPAYCSWKKQWSSQEGLDVYSYIFDQCQPEHILLFSKMLFPDFVVKEGGVFLARNFSTEVLDRCSGLASGDISKTEKLLNVVRFYDVFGQVAAGVSDDVFLQLCNVIGFAWRMVLKEKFPEKVFCVEVSNSEQNYGPDITFYQVGSLSPGAEA